jgi:hypothetical protein
MLLLYTSPFLRISYDQPLRLIELEWLSSAADGDDMRAGFWQALLLAERYQVRAWYGDFRMLPPMPDAVQHWLQQHWFPRYLRLSLDKIAVVNATLPDSQQTIDHVVQLAEAARNGVHPETRYFDDVAEARSWIKTPLVVPQLPSER